MITISMGTSILLQANRLGVLGRRSLTSIRHMLRQMLVLMVCQMATTTHHQPQIPLTIFAQVEFKSTWPRILRALSSEQVTTEVVMQFLPRKLQ